MHILVVGNIASGKETIICELSKRLMANPIYEQVQGNPYLEDFYKDMKQWSFRLELYQMIHLARKQYKATYERLAIQESGIYPTLHVFTETLHDREFISDRDYRLLHDVYDAIEPFLTFPSVVIYLQANESILLERIKRRGRAMEQGIDLKYLKHLTMYYDRWMHSVPRQRTFWIDNSELSIDQTVDRILEDSRVVKYV